MDGWTRMNDASASTRRRRRGRTRGRSRRRATRRSRDRAGRRAGRRARDAPVMSRGMTRGEELSGGRRLGVCQRRGVEPTFAGVRARKSERVAAAGTRSRRRASRATWDGRRRRARAGGNARRTRRPRVEVERFYRGGDDDDFIPRAAAGGSRGVTDRGRREGSRPRAAASVPTARVDFDRTRTEPRVHSPRAMSDSDSDREEREDETLGNVGFASRVLSLFAPVAIRPIIIRHPSPSTPARRRVSATRR